MNPLRKPTHRTGALSARRALSVGLVVAATLVAATRGARAQQEDPRAIAKEKLLQGSEFLKQGEYKAALDTFKEAYELVPSPKIQYNFGLAYMGLARNADAMEAFDKFLSEAADANPDLRANAERHRSVLSQKTGSLIVTCDVDGADVSVDGRAYGVTPLKNPVRLDPGPHQLVVEKAGVPPFTQKLDTTPGQRLPLEVKLAKAVPAEPSAPVATPVAPVPVPPSEAEAPFRWKKKAAWATAAGAAAFVGFGIVEQLKASSSFSDFNSAMPPLYGKCDADNRVYMHGGGNCSDLLSSGNSAKTLAIVGFAAGGVLAAASVGLFYLAHREEAHGESMALGCAPALGQPGMSCALRF